MASNESATATDYDELIESGKERGHVTFEDIYRALDDDATAADMDALLEDLEENHIRIVKSESDLQDGDSAAPAPEAQATRSGPAAATSSFAGAPGGELTKERIASHLDAKAQIEALRENLHAPAEGTGKIDDPVRLYLM